MKKYLIFLTMAILVLPNIAFASWWNPFSWNIFSKVFRSKTEIVQVATSSDTTASTREEIEKTVKSEPEVEKVSPTVKTTTTPKSEVKNYAPGLVEIAKEEANSVRKLMILTAAYHVGIEADISELEDKISTLQAYAKGYGKNEISDSFIDSYSKDINNSTVYLDDFKKISTSISNKYTHFSKYATQLDGTFVSFEQFPSILWEINSEDNKEEIYSDIEQKRKSYEEYRENMKKEYRNAIITLQGVSDRMSQNQTTGSSYESLIPKTQTTMCSSDGLGGFMCKTF